MAPRGSKQEPRTIYELGKKGRRTGVDLRDTGIRDENGLMPIEGLFSSPSKAGGATPNGDQTGEQDMELDTPGPGPATVLRHQHLPRGRSPLKTNLQSPAVRNPHLGAASSPTRGSVVRQRNVEVEEETTTITTATRRSQVNGSRSKAGRKTKTNGGKQAARTEEEEEESILHGRGDDASEDSMQLINESLQAQEEDVQEESQHPEEEDGDEEEEEEEAPWRRDRARKRPDVNMSKKRNRNSSVAANQEEDERAWPKRQKMGAKTGPKMPTVGKGKRGRARPNNADTSLLEVQQGPPLPKSRGLVSIHRDASVIQQTRSGRHSYRPLEYWKGEHVEFESRPEGREDIFRSDGGRMVLPTLKEVVRVENQEPAWKKTSKSRGGGPKANTSRKRAASRQEPDEDLEDWERVPGRLEGETVVWEATHELAPPAPGEPAQVMVDNIAVSSAGVVTKDIKDASFKFAKTMNTPFMGTGIVDLPPGAEKKMKNSRKMQMAFFVFYGKVLVTVHETEFRISTGGHWFVPRGNYYSIQNDYDTPARIFFAQACEMHAPQPEPELEYYGSQ